MPRHIPHLADAALAAAYWADKEVKKWAVDVVAGPAYRRTYESTHYAAAKTAKGAIAAVKNAPVVSVKGAHFTARLAGPHELGCVTAALQSTLNPPGGTKVEA